MSKNRRDKLQKMLDEVIAFEQIETPLSKLVKEIAEALIFDCDTEHMCREAKNRDHNPYQPSRKLNKLDRHED